MKAERRSDYHDKRSCLRLDSILRSNTAVRHETCLEFVLKVNSGECANDGWRESPSASETTTKKVCSFIQSRRPKYALVPAPSHCRYQC